jgi:molybdate transport system substrate-binding protein
MIGVAVVLLQTATATATEIKVISSVAMRPAYSVLAPQFESATGHKLVLKLMASPAVARLIEAGESFDVAITNPKNVDGLIKSGKIVADSRADIARSPIGLVARAGSSRLDISSVESFKHVLLSAKSVGHSVGGVGAHFKSILTRLGIAERMKDKLKVLPAMGGPEWVAKGEVEYAIVATVAIPGVAGVQLVGVVPSELQSYIEFSGGIGTGAMQPEKARAWISFITAPAADVVLKSKGMERITR